MSSRFSNTYNEPKNYSWKKKRQRHKLANELVQIQ